MTTPGQSFFAAYNHAAPVMAPAATTRKPAAPAPTNAQGRGESVEAMYSTGAWYRVDARHPAPAGKPHRPQPQTEPQKPHIEQKKSFETQAVNIGWLGSDADLQSSCVVIGPSLLPAAPPVAESPKASERSDTADRNRKSRSSHSQFAELGGTDGRHTTDESDDAEKSSWAATWEVDEFAWPDDVAKLFESHRDYFQYAGQKLLDASREGLKVLAVAATREKEGCTTLAICLARGAAAAGARVALLDGNLSNPELGLLLGLDFANGWQDASHGESPLNENAVLSLDDGVTLFPLSTAHRVATLNDSSVTRLLNELAGNFDLVIVDAGTATSGETAPFEPGDDCPVNAAMIVRDMRRSTEAETMVTASRLKGIGIEAIGIAENFAPRPVVTSAAA